VLLLQQQFYTQILKLIPPQGSGDSSNFAEGRFQINYFFLLQLVVKSTWTIFSASKIAGFPSSDAQFCQEPQI
jgi:hypothetical protein